MRVCPPPQTDLINVDEVIGKYYDLVPDPSVAEQRVSFGTSGHRGSSLKTSFNEAHIVAITQAHRRIPQDPGRHRSAVHRPRHPRPVRAGMEDRHRGARRQRRACAHRFARRLHPHPGRLPGHPDPQPRRGRHAAVLRRGPGRRHRGHPLAQPADRRRLQVRPADRRPRPGRGDQRHRRARQRTARRLQERQARPVRAGRQVRSGRTFRLPRPLRLRPGQRHRFRRDPFLGRASGHRPARRRVGELLAADEREVRPDDRRGAPRGRSDLELHDHRPRRQDPHGPELDLRHEGPGRRAQRRRVGEVRPGRRVPIRMPTATASSARTGA